MRRFLVAVLLFAVLTPVSAAASKSEASCAVAPASVAASGSVTITASANTTLFDFYLREPGTGRAYYWPTNPAGSVTYTTPVPKTGATPVTGVWTVVVEEVGVRNVNHKAIASCAFTVLP